MLGSLGLRVAQGWNTTCYKVDVWGLACWELRFGAPAFRAEDMGIGI